MIETTDPSESIAAAIGAAHVSYKKDQGRYARMTAFWALFALLGYGCFTGLVHQLLRWKIGGGDAYVENMPLLGDVDLSMTLTLLVLAVGAFAIHTFLERPKVADLLIDTESEMRKVTWPSAADTWAGTIAVMVTVAVMLTYLFAADYLLSFVMPRLLGAS